MGRRLNSQRPQGVFKRIKQKRPLKVHPPMLGGVSKTRSTQLPLEDWVFKSISECWSRATTLIPFLQAIEHFCGFVPSC